MPQIMRPRAATPGPGCQSCPSGQLDERLADVDVPQPVPGAGYQQRITAWPREHLAAEPLVGLQRGHRGLVQREQPPLAELGVRHDQHPLSCVEVAVIEGQGFADPHAGYRQQPDQGLDGGGAQRGPQPLRLGKQRRDVSSGIQVGDRAVTAAWQQAGRDDLSSRVEGAQVGGEATGHRHAERKPARARAGRQGGPGQRVRRRDRDRSGLFQVTDELGEQPGVAVQLESHAAAQVQVAGQCLAQPGHDRLPGHGRARPRNASTLTLA
jgi:hypothetical protein